MTDKEINEYLAEHMFGLNRQKDFGEWEEHDWQRDKNGEIDNSAFENDYHYGPVCSRCYDLFCVGCCADYEKRIHEGPCFVEAPDYIKNFQEVIDKAQSIVIKKQSNLDIFEVYFNGSKAEDKVLGKAICLSAIKWLEETKA